MTRRTFFEADLTDQRREEEEKALLISEEKDREKQAKKANSKQGKSPRENRKGSTSSLNAVTGGCSPSPGLKTSGMYMCVYLIMLIVLFVFEACKISLSSLSSGVNTLYMYM